MNGRRRYLESLAGTVLAASAGCLGGDSDDIGDDTSTDASESDSTTDVDATTAGTGPASGRSTRTAEAGETRAVRDRPTLSLSFEFERGSANRVSITHEGGDAVDGTRVTVAIGDTVAWEDGGVVTSNYREVTDEWGVEIATGDELTVADGKGTPIEDDQRIEIAWTPEGGDPVLIGMSEVSL